MHLHGSTIQPSLNVKNLGVYFDRHMTFDIHISEISKKVTGVLMHISRIKDHFDKPSRITVVQSLVLSIIKYCNVIWGTTNNTLITKVQKLQNFTAKVADGKSKKFNHITPTLKELGWLNAKDKIIYDTGRAIYSHLNHLHPDYLLSLPRVNNITQSITTQQSLPYVPRVRTDAGERSLAVRERKCGMTSLIMLEIVIPSDSSN